MTKKAFTLIEVMVAVIIISVVLTALIKMNANNIYLFSHINKKTTMEQYLSLLYGSNYGFINEDVTMDKMLNGFVLDDTLRQELKGKKVKINYQNLIKPDNNGSNLFQIGRSILQIDKVSSDVLRIQAQ